MPVDERVVRRLKLNDLRVFQAVVEHGGMNRAAAHLNISQPAVSKAVSALESTLRVRLLDRSPQGVEPTIYGRALIDGGVAVFDELTKSVKQIEYLADPTAGELRIGCTEAGAAGVVPAIVERLSKRYPRLIFRITTADPATLIERELPQRKIDLAIGAVPPLEPAADIETTILYEDRHYVMAGEANTWTRRRNVKLADLVQESWILPPPESLMGTQIAEAFRSHGCDPPAQVISFSIPLCHRLLATGRFLTLHPVIMCRLAKLPLKRVDTNFSGIARPVGVMTRKNRTVSPLVQLFIDCANDITKPLTNRT